MGRGPPVVFLWVLCSAWNIPHSGSYNPCRNYLDNTITDGMLSLCVRFPLSDSPWGTWYKPIYSHTASVCLRVFFGVYPMEKKTHVPTMEELSDIDCVFGGAHYTLEPKLFRTGSRGWCGSCKAKVDGWRCQVSINVTIIGSKGKKDGEQIDTVAEKAPEAPLFDRADENGIPPAKPPRKRSGAS